MTVLKYFYEEPTSLETLTPDLDADARQRGRTDDIRRTSGRSGPRLSLEALFSAQRYYRGYLAGTDMATDRTGLTATPDPLAYTAPLADLTEGRTWHRLGASDDAQPEPVADLAAALAGLASTALLIAVPEGARFGPAALRAALPAEDGGATERREALEGLRALLDAGALVAFPEPAHHGHDLSLFSATPLKSRLAEAFAQHPTPGARRFLVPFRRARSEHKFYFERWQLDALPDFIEEV